VSAIEDKNRQSAGKTESLAGKLINHPAAAGYSRRLNWTVLLSAITACIMLASGPTTASEFMVDVKSIAQIRVDDDNRAINYPVAIYLDPVEEELYLINGGKNRVVVYGPDYFPRTSIGIGRDVISPRGVTVMNNGEVYLGQVVTYKNPRPRITILNAAFFLEREIFLDEIPEIEKFRPRNSAMSYDGILYQTGDDFRGVLVFDNEGNFLRLLQPTDHITLRGKEAEAYTEQELLLSEEAQGMGSEEDLYADIPEEFRPVITQDSSREINGPVKINYVTIDRSGKLYLLSAESGKIYVYGPDENFLFSFGTKGGSPGQMSNPRALVIDEEIGVIYVVDYMRHTILAYNMAGEYVFEIGGRGSGPMYFNFPNDLAINNRGQLIVADLFNNRVQVLEVSKEGIFYYLNKLSEESLSEESLSEESLEDIAATIKSTEFGESESLQPGIGEDQGNIPDASLESPEGVVIVEDEANGAEEDREHHERDDRGRQQSAHRFRLQPDRWDRADELG